MRFPAWRRLSTVLLCLAAIGVLAGLPVLRARVAAEQADRRVQLAVGQVSFLREARFWGVKPLTFLRQLRRAGATGLAVTEATPASLAAAGSVSLFSGTQLASVERFGGASPPPFRVRPYATYLLTRRPALALWLRRSLALAAGPAVGVSAYRAGRTRVLAVGLPPAAVGSLPLGFPPGAFSLARAAGMDVLPRPLLTPRPMPAAAVRRELQGLRRLGGGVHTVVFAGPATAFVPGYPSHPGIAARALGHNQIGVIEQVSQLSNIDPKGTRRLGQALGGRVVRVYGVPPWVLTSAGGARLAIADSVVERNLRVVYLHPLIGAKQSPAADVRFVRALAAGLRRRGFILGTPRPFPAIRVPAAQRTLQGLGAMATALLWIELAFPAWRGRKRWPVVALLALAAGVAAASSHLGTLAAALGAAASFGGLATWFLVGLWKRAARPAGARSASPGAIWLAGLSTAAGMFGISLAGGVLLGSLLASTPFLLAWDFFRGVKLVYLGLPALTALAFALRVGLQPPSEGGPAPLVRQLRWIGRQAVEFRYVAAFLLCAFIGFVYLARSGNVDSGILVPHVEVLMREWLQRTLIYRPREKDFLIGYPSVFLAAFCASRGWRWPFGFFVLGASASVVSVIDAFEHARTPFLNNVLRESYGLGLGVLLATLALAVALFVEAAWRRRAQAAGRAGAEG